MDSGLRGVPLNTSSYPSCVCGHCIGSCEILCQSWKLIAPQFPCLVGNSSQSFDIRPDLLVATESRWQNNLWIADTLSCNIIIIIVQHFYKNHKRCQQHYS